MNYYQVGLSTKLKSVSDDLPVYHSQEKLEVGRLVLAPFGKRSLTGIIFARTSKPKFKTKPVEKLDFKLPPPQLNFAKDVASYYHADLNQVLNLMIPSNIKTKSRLKLNDDQGVELQPMPELNPNQQAALSLINKSEARTAILNGETGSGKSYIYLELAKRAVEEGKSVILMAPEISLSPQLVELFSRHIDIPIVNINSSLSLAEKRDAWIKINSLPTCIIIGPRSALFSPVNNLGLIIIDEFHDSSYKSEVQPKYNTREAASLLTGTWQSKLILGSATPKIQDYWLAENKNIPIIKLSKMKQEEIDVQIVDQNQKSAFIKSKILSEAAIDAIKLNLKSGHQTIIFHNQRGTARGLICTECDWHYSCDKCDSRLIYHSTQSGDGIFYCHLCSKKFKLVTQCALEHNDLKLVGFGTKKLVEEVARLFPEAEICRMDTDQSDIDVKLKGIRDGKFSIIIGTQMLAKGHNFPKLKTIVIPQADSGLSGLDYSSTEKTYQLLKQVIGRVGRFGESGQIIVQTFSPKNRILSLALNNQFDDFYEAEIEERRLSLMPPFSFALKVSAAYANQDYASKKLEQFAKSVAGIGIRYLGPSPAFQKKVNSKFKYQLVFLSPNRNKLLAIVDKLPANFQFDIDPINFL